MLLRDSDTRGQTADIINLCSAGANPCKKVLKRNNQMCLAPLCYISFEIYIQYIFVLPPNTLDYEETMAPVIQNCTSWEAMWSISFWLHRNSYCICRRMHHGCFKWVVSMALILWVTLLPCNLFCHCNTYISV